MSETADVIEHLWRERPQRYVLSHVPGLNLTGWNVLEQLADRQRALGPRPRKAKPKAISRRRKANKAARKARKRQP